MLIPMAGVGRRLMAFSTLAVLQIQFLTEGSACLRIILYHMMR